MVIWITSWIRLPARPSNSTCAVVLTASRLTRRRDRWCARLAALLLTTRRPPDCASGFNFHCEKRLPSEPPAPLRRTLSRCSREGRHRRGPFVGTHHGIG